jgi:hypothetical protein
MNIFFEGLRDFLPRSTNTWRLEKFPSTIWEVKYDQLTQNGDFKSFQDLALAALKEQANKQWE